MPSIPSLDKYPAYPEIRLAPQELTVYQTLGPVPSLAGSGYHSHEANVLIKHMEQLNKRIEEIADIVQKIATGAVVPDEKPSDPGNPVQDRVDAVIGDLKTWPGTSRQQEEALGRALQDRKVGRIGR